MRVRPSGDEIIPDIIRLRSCATFPGNDLRVDSPWPCEFDFLGVKETNFWGLLKIPNYYAIVSAAQAVKNVKCDRTVNGKDCAVCLGKIHDLWMHRTETNMM
jgi:hypothetical protein